MSKNKEREVEDEVEEVKEVKRSDAYVAYVKLIESYKKQNPVKYEIKKDVLAARLAAL